MAALVGAGVDLSLHAAGNITVFDGTQSRVVGLADLAGGAGANYHNSLVFASTFTLRVSSSGPCQLWVRRQDTGTWLSAGELQVRILRIGDNLDPREPITLSPTDSPLTESAVPLDNQLYELRYQLENFSAQNSPGSYATQVVFTLTDA